MERKKLYLTVLLLLLIVFTLCFIWGNSLLDRNQSQGMSNRLLDFLRPFLAWFGIQPENDHVLRKLAHFGEFGILGVELALLVLLHKGFSFRFLSFAVFFCGFTAVTDESIQYFTGRACQISDMMLDFSGSVCGIAAICVLSLIFSRQKN